MFEIVNKIKRAMGRISKDVDKYQSAVAFAEANNPEAMADFIPREETVEEAVDHPSRILVVGNESSFSEDVIQYALDMASRMSYEIVALSSAPLSCGTFKLFSDSRNQVCNDFQKLSETSAASFQEMAESKGIAFQHVVKFTESESAVEEVVREIGPIDFIVSDNHESAENRLENDNRPRNEIFVYSMLVQ